MACHYGNSRNRLQTCSSGRSLREQHLCETPEHFEMEDDVQKCEEDAGKAGPGVYI